MIGGRYKVTGRTAYRGHKPGTIFDAVLDPAAESRAIARGNITKLAHREITLPKRAYRLPDGWTTNKRTSKEV